MGFNRILVMAAFVVVCTVQSGDGQAAVYPGSSSLIETLDYSDEFTTGPAGVTPLVCPWRDLDFFHNATDDPAYAYYHDIQTTYHGLPSVQWQRPRDFSFVNNWDAGGHDPAYPGNTGNLGANKGRALFGSGEASIDYGLGSDYLVQFDGIIPIQSNGELEIGSYAHSPGNWWDSYNEGVTVRFKRDGRISLVGAATSPGVGTETIVPGFTTGLSSGDQTWHNFGVRFNQSANSLSVFVDETYRGTVDMSTFYGGIYNNYSNSAVAIGTSANRGWIDNFQVGSPSSGADPIDPPDPPIDNSKLGTPNVMYWSSPHMGDNAAQHALNGGYNVVWISDIHTSRSLEEQMAKAEEYGLRAQINSSLARTESLSDPTKLAQLDALIDQFKASPSTYRYIIADEPHASDFSDLAQLVNYIRERDPDHMAYINLYPTYASPEQLGTSTYAEYLDQYISIVKPSMLSYDHYNLKYNGDFSAGGTNQYFENLSMVAQRARDADIPFMNIVQAIASVTAWRPPDAEELRHFNYTTLAYGGQGMGYYNYHSQGTDTGGLQNNGDGSLSPVNAALTVLNREFVKIAEEIQRQELKSADAYVLGDQPLGTTRLPGVPGVWNPAIVPFSIMENVPDTTYTEGQPVDGLLLGYFGPDTELLNATSVMVVNNDYTVPKTVTLQGPNNLSVFDASTGMWMPQGSSQTTLNLLPGGGMLVGLTSTIPIQEPPFSTFGDANLDGMVNHIDAAIIAANWQSTGVGWTEGDFNNDGTVNDIDATIMASNWKAGEPWPSPELGMANYTSERIASTNYTVSNTDLLQTSLDSVETVGDLLHHPGFPGVIGEPALRDGNFPFNVAYAGTGESVTYTLDTTTNVDGYDITKIATYSSGNTDRYQQVYDLYVHHVGDAADDFERIAMVIFRPAAIGNLNSSKVEIDPPSGLLAGGVDKIRFVFGDADVTFQGYRELDVFGTPSAAASVPEPATVSLLITGLLGLLTCSACRKWR